MTQGFASLLLAVLALASTAGAQATDLAFNGYARDPGTRRLLYVEAHYVRGFGSTGESRVVLYRCAGGAEAFARKELRYGTPREVPEFTLLDARTGYTEGLRRTPRGPQVFQKPLATATLRQATLPDSAGIVADAGFDEFVRRHWADLEAGRTLRFPFLVPSRLDFLTFEVRKQREENIEGSAASVIRLNLSGVLGWFVPFIEVSYGKNDRLLHRYSGLTNIRDADGNNVAAVIDFPQAERRTLAAGAAGAAEVERQRAAPLVQRCAAG